MDTSLEVCGSYLESVRSILDDHWYGVEIQINDSHKYFLNASKQKACFPLDNATKLKITFIKGKDIDKDEKSNLEVMYDSVVKMAKYTGVDLTFYKSHRPPYRKDYLSRKILPSYTYNVTVKGSVVVKFSTQVNKFCTCGKKPGPEGDDVTGLY